LTHEIQKSQADDGTRPNSPNRVSLVLIPLFEFICTGDIEVSLIFVILSFWKKKITRLFLFTTDRRL